MEINPKVISNYKHPKPLFHANTRSNICKLIMDIPKTGSRVTRDVAVHQYKNNNQHGYFVPCVAPYHDCPHCELGGKIDVVTYTFHKSGIFQHDLCHDKENADYDYICLLSFCTGHKCAFSLNSFQGIYPVAILSYADFFIKDMYTTARETFNAIS